MVITQAIRINSPLGQVPKEGGQFSSHNSQVRCMCAQSCPALCDRMDCSPPGSSLSMEIFQARILERVTISSSSGSSQPRDSTCISCAFCIGRQIPYHCTTWESQNSQKGDKICVQAGKVLLSMGSRPVAEVGPQDGQQQWQSKYSAGWNLCNTRRTTSHK